METETILETEHFIGKIFIEDRPSSPRDWDNLGTIVTTKNRYFSVQEGNLDIDEIDGNKELMAFPLYAYVHGNIVLSVHPFSCPWDSGQIGFIYATKEQIRREYKVKRITKNVIEKVLSLFKSEIETINAYLNGEVYGYLIEETETCEHVASCCGFYSMEHVEQEIKEMIDYLEAEYEKK